MYHLHGYESIDGDSWLKLEHAEPRRTTPNHCRCNGMACGGLKPYSVNAKDIEIAASELSPDSIAAVLVWEDTWATRFAETMRAAGGRVVEDDRIPHEVVEAAMQASVGTSA